jgi:hypothetical protein
MKKLILLIVTVCTLSGCVPCHAQTEKSIANYENEVIGGSDLSS